MVKFLGKAENLHDEGVFTEEEYTRITEEIEDKIKTIAGYVTPFPIIDNPAYRNPLNYNSSLLAGGLSPDDFVSFLSQEPSPVTGMKYVYTIDSGVFSVMISHYKPDNTSVKGLPPGTYKIILTLEPREYSTDIRIGEHSMKLGIGPKAIDGNSWSTTHNIDIYEYPNDTEYNYAGEVEVYEFEFLVDQDLNYIHIDLDYILSGSTIDVNILDFKLQCISLGRTGKGYKMYRGSK